MANRTKGNKVHAEPPSGFRVRGLRNPQCALRDKKDNLHGRFKGKGLLKALVAEKKREKGFT